jgi:hypothetical protein
MLRFRGRARARESVDGSLYPLEFFSLIDHQIQKYRVRIVD